MIRMPKKEKLPETKEQKWAQAVKKKARVFILDDHPVVRHGLAQWIDMQAGFEVVGQAASASEALAAFASSKPDIAVVDITLNGSNGIEFIKTAKEEYPEMLFLINSMHDETLYGERALRAGARGYIMKHEAPEKVILAIRRILSGQIYMSDMMMERMLEQRYNGTPDNLTPMEALSDRELEVFQFIGRGETTAGIAKLLHRSVKTIETYRGRIKEKLSLKDNMQLIRHAMQSVYTEGSEAEKPSPEPSKVSARKVQHSAAH